MRPIIQLDDLALMGFCLGIGLFYQCFSAELFADSFNSKTSQCSTEFIPRELLSQLPKSSSSDKKDDIFVTSDKAYVENGKIFHFEGNVRLQQSDEMLRADTAVYDKEEHRIDARGAVKLQTNHQLITGDEAHINVSKDDAELSNPEFWLTESHLRGKALSVNVVEKNRLVLKQVEFTSCDKDDEDWKLRASEMQLNQSENEGIAYNARIEFMHVPFIYLPYMSFPLVGRKTGFLVPSIGSSTASGDEIALPYYINIAPNRDATFTPRYYDKRGFQYTGEYRYLHEHSRGQMELEYLPNDRLTNTNRIYASYYHQGVPASGWNTDVLIQYASDSNYFDEFENSLSSSSVSNLERHLDINYGDKYWAINSRFQYYQSLDETISPSDKPYAKRPQIQFILKPYNFPIGLETSANAEFISFYRAEGITGDRTDIMPEISWPYRADPGYIQPTIKFRHTQYHLYNQQSFYDTQTSRTLPIFSIDSGLFFDSDDKKGNTLVQTVEPRLYYLYVPYRNQDNLIVDSDGKSITFDSSLPSFSFADLFRDNRFSGVDRVGDANQLSVALTSRILTQSGAEWLNASIGEIIYFRDRKVVIPGGALETTKTSDIAAELHSYWGRKLESNANLLWNNDYNGVYRGTMQFRYLFDRGNIFYLSYRYERKQINQADISVLWRLTQRWKGVYRWYYSFLDDIKLETSAGLEYDSCCWAFRIVRRDYVSDLGLLGERRNQTIMMQLELKGLASVGSKVDSTFDTGLFEF